VSTAASQVKKRVAIAIGDPAGIGCEIALKALGHPGIRASCMPVIVGDAWLIRRCNEQFNTGFTLRTADSASDLRFDGEVIDVLDVPMLDAPSFTFGVVDAVNGKALIEYAAKAVRLAVDKVVDAVVCAPQNQTSVHRAGIPFDGYASFVARQTHTPEENTFLLLVSKSFRICHVTLHVSLLDAIKQVRHAKVKQAIHATNVALKKMGIARPRIAVSGLNPHAGEGGLWGREEIDEIAPAVAAAKAEGVAVAGPFGADVMLAQGGYDGYVVMLHDQGHIPGKLEPASVGFYAGVPILCASVAHGSAHDIAGKGVADPASIVNALRWAMGI
jgi:4-phospho-D-threonate 3-dehydrogenase / 4-phospho-D-erythronate 3-dehydrogenase